MEREKELSQHAYESRVSEAQQVANEEIGGLEEKLPELAGMLDALDVHMGMTSLSKFGFGMGEVEDDVSDLAKKQYDVQTQIKTLVERIATLQQAGAREQYAAIAG